MSKTGLWIEKKDWVVFAPISGVHKSGDVVETCFIGCRDTSRRHVKCQLVFMFNRRISILDSRRIPDVFHPQIDIDPVDIIDLEAGKQYSVTPKSSRLYFNMLDKLFKEYQVLDLDASTYSETLYASFADKLSWWFSRLLGLEDNDLKSYEGFDFIEVLYICNKLFDELFDQSPEDIHRFKELLPAIKEYVSVRLLLYERHVTFEIK